MSKGVQYAIPVLSVEGVKYRGGQCLVRVNVRYHLLNVPYHTLFVGQDRASDFTEMVTPYRY